MFIQQYNRQDVKIEKVTKEFNGYLKIFKYQLQHRLFNGDWSNSFTRELMDRGNAVAVLLYDPRLDAVVLVEQFRIGAYAANRTYPWQLEIVAGVIDTNESAASIAERECYEEAGIEITKVEKILNFFPTAGGCNESIALYFASVDATNVGGIYGLSCENEDIKVHVMPRAQAYSLIKKANIESASTIIALQWLELNYKKIAI